MTIFSRYFAPLLIAAAGLASWCNPALAADEVKLLKVNSIFSSYKGPWLRGSFETIVTNLAYAKQVHIHYKKTDGTWGDYALTYNRPASAGKEVWSANFTNTSGGIDLPGVTEPIEFAVKYTVNGTTYWDNNNGANYRIKQDGGTILVGSNVYNAIYNPTVTNTNTVYGYATVKNIALAKSVEIIYSLDNWATTQKVPATFSSSFWSGGYSSAPNPNGYGFEEWNYAIPVGNTATRLQYAIKYTVNGISYWDNNFGRNYSTTIAR